MNLVAKDIKEIIDPLGSFYEVAAKDAIINTTHISLYFTLCYQWQLNNCINPFEIKRDVVMRLAKINSRETFNKSMHILHDAGYIKYVPSFNPEISSMVCLALIN